LGISLERSPKPGAWQQVKAENQVATGQIAKNRKNVNGYGDITAAMALIGFSNW
jgi:hypothetical protein